MKDPRGLNIATSSVRSKSRGSCFNENTGNFKCKFPIFCCEILLRIILTILGIESKAGTIIIKKISQDY